MAYTFEVKTNPTGAVVLWDPWRWNQYNHFYGLTNCRFDVPDDSTLAYKLLIKKPGYLDYYLNHDVSAGPQTYNITLTPSSTPAPPVSNKCVPPETQEPRYPGFHAIKVIENRLPSYVWMLAFGAPSWYVSQVCEQIQNIYITNPECKNWDCCRYYIYQPPSGYTVIRECRVGITFGEFPWCPPNTTCGWPYLYVELSGPEFPLSPPCANPGESATDYCNNCLYSTVEHTCAIHRINKYDPVAMGVGCGRDNWVGTLGCIVRDVTDGTNVFLSNEHVFGRPFRTPGASVGDLIYQPGQNEYGASGVSRPIGALKRWGGIYTDRENFIDAAIASIGSGIYYDNRFVGSDSSPSNYISITGYRDAYEGMSVIKYGRTSGITTGEVISTSYSINVAYDTGSGTSVIAPFTDQILVAATGCPGDSGSIVTDVYGKIIGILFAGGADATGQSFIVVSKIRKIIEALNINVLSSDNTPLSIENMNVYNAGTSGGNNIVRLDVTVKNISPSPVSSFRLVTTSQPTGGSVTTTLHKQTVSIQPGATVVIPLELTLAAGTYNICTFLP